MEIKLLFKDHLDLRPVSLLADGTVRKEKENSAQKKKKDYRSLHVIIPVETFFSLYIAVFGLHSANL